MLPGFLSSSGLRSNEASNISSEARVFASDDFRRVQEDDSSPDQLQDNKRKRKVAGNPDPGAEVMALSPETLLTTNRFICEICNKGFQRDQNLQLHRRGHNLPWKLKQRDINDTRKKVYVCPEATCIHHHPSRALGDLTGIKKHYCRKHGQKQWKCNKCNKEYAVLADWKAHVKICGTKEYKCDCGTIFTRRDSFITHRAFCDALAQERARVSTTIPAAYSVTAPYSTTTATAAIPQAPLPPPPPPQLQPQPPFFSPNNHHFPNFHPVQNPTPNPNFTNINQETTLPHFPNFHPVQNPTPNPNFTNINQETTLPHFSNFHPVQNPTPNPNFTNINQETTLPHFPNFHPVQNPTPNPNFTNINQETTLTHFPNFHPVQNPTPNPNFTNINQETTLTHFPLLNPPLFRPETTLTPSFRFNATLAPVSAPSLFQRTEMKNTAGTTTDGFTRDFLGLATGNRGGGSGGNGGGSDENAGDMLKYAVGVELPDPCEFGH